MRAAARALQCVIGKVGHQNLLADLGRADRRGRRLFHLPTDSGLAYGLAYGLADHAIFQPLAKLLILLEATPGIEPG
jgi:hypothetical protein